MKLLKSIVLIGLIALSGCVNFDALACRVGGWEAHEVHVCLENGDNSYRYEEYYCDSGNSNHCPEEDVADDSLVNK